MDFEDEHELPNIHEITDHAFYFYAACRKKSIGGGAKLIGSTPRSMLNHIKWLQCLTGKKLLEEVEPGRTMQLSKAGKKLCKQIMEDFHTAVKNLNASKMDGVLGNSFVEVIKNPYWSYRPLKKQTKDSPTTIHNRSETPQRTSSPNKK